MTRIAMFLYGIACYGAFFATTLYAVAFLGNFALTNTMDSQPLRPVAEALAIDMALLAVFALQHSVMARPGFKRLWTRVIPRAAERSTYVLFSSAALMLLMWQWEPIGGTVWDVRGGVLEGVMVGGFAAGLILVLLSTFLINHFDLFGLRQVTLHMAGREYTQPEFRTPLFYRHVRHPIYVGWLLSFWCTPLMTSAHLVFALMTTAYILVAIRFEERDLLAIHGEDYARYREQVPMIVPSLSPRIAHEEPAPQTRAAISTSRGA